MAQFQLVMRSGPNPGQTYPLEGNEVIVGRDTSNQVAINDAEVSRKHARFSLHRGAYMLEDLGSTNGTFVNGQRLTSSMVLNPGDSVSFGENIVLVYESAYDPNATAISSAKAFKTEAKAQKPAPAPAPAPVYSGQVPAGPAAKPKRKFPLWLILVILLLVVVCACVVFFIVIDQLKLWCTVVPFLVPLLGGTC
jgi:predicted component of type VI protein secretion system